MSFPRRFLSVAAALLGFAASSAADSANKRMDDRSPLGPTIDGVFSPGEYHNGTEGVGTGFGSMIGAGTHLWVDSAADGSLGFLLDQTGQGCALGADDSIVLYFETRPGGIKTTYHLTDFSDGGRRAVSGFDGTNRAELDFNSGLLPDFALVVRADSASLYELVEDAPLVFVKSVTRAPAVGFGTSCIKEFGGFSMSDLGVGPGHELTYIATLINASNAYRSDEFQGIYGFFGEADASGNIGARPVSIPEHNAFLTYAPTAALYHNQLTVGFEDFGGTGFAPGLLALPSQLPSENWAMTGWSDGNLMFGGSALAGDYARGFAGAPVTTPGVYAVDTGDGNIALGIQQGLSDFDPGTVTFRFQNLTGKNIVNLVVGWTLFYRNDTPSITTVKAEASLDGLVYKLLGDWATPGTATVPDWGPIYTGALADLGVAAPGSYIYLRFTAQSSGGAAKDEIALDDINFVPSFIPNCYGAGASDFNVCTIEYCNPMDGGTYSDPEPAGKPCFDGDLCTINETCNGMGMCQGTPKCSAPPAECFDANTSLSHKPGCFQGSCYVDDMYTPCAMGCNPATGLCISPCDLITCDSPPATACADDFTLIEYSSPGTCNNGSCSYPYSFTTCPFGCDAAQAICLEDQCIGVVCDSPGQCETGPGVCNGGACLYPVAPIGSPCDDNNPQTDNETCDDAGNCVGLPGTGGGGAGGSGGMGGGNTTGGMGGGNTTGGAGGGNTTGGGNTGGASGGTGGAEGGSGGGGGSAEPGGCGCSVPDDSTASGWPLALGLALLGLRRKRRATPGASA